MGRRIDYSRAMAKETLGETLFMRITKADKELLDRVAERFPMNTSQIARIALRVGLGEIEKDPSRIFAAAAGAKPAKKR